MRVSVRVRPGARVDLVGGRYGDREPPVLVVRVRAPAVDGKANAAVERALAAALGVPSRDVRIVTRLTSRSKTVEIPMGAGDRFAELVAAPSG
jgi:uncharacterized protein